MDIRIFKDEQHQALFDKQGFIVLPFLTEEEVTKLDAFFDALHPEINQKGFFSGSYSPDFEYKKKASDAIVAVFSKHYEELFIDYSPFGGAFLCKTPGENSALAAHQDWTIVDENNAVALNCWVPLCDIQQENGPIMVLPGTQFANTQALRAPTLPFFFSGHEEIIHSQLEPMLVKAGTAVILNQSVIHYSPNNTTNNIRKAITAGVKSAGAQMVFHYKLPDKNELEIFEEDDDFLIRFDNFFEDIFQRPKNGNSMGFMPYELPQYDKDGLVAAITKMKEQAGFDVKPFPQNEMVKNTVPRQTEHISLFKKIARFMGV